VAAGHKAIPPQSEKPPAYPVDRDHQLNAPKGNDAGGLKLRSGYALPAFQASGILILIDAPLSASLSRCRRLRQPLLMPFRRRQELARLGARQQGLPRDPDPLNWASAAMAKAPSVDLGLPVIRGVW